MDPLFIPIFFPYLEEDKENIKTTENRESLCTSAKSYEKKLQYLQSEKERIIKAYNDNNEAIEKLRKGSYLEKMVKEQDGSLKRAFIQMFASGVGGAETYYMWQQYLNGNLDITKLAEYLLYVGGCYFIPVGAAVCAILYVKNFINYVRYDNEIEAYLRKIK